MLLSDVFLVCVGIIPAGGAKPPLTATCFKKQNFVINIITKIISPYKYFKSHNNRVFNNMKERKIQKLKSSLWIEMAPVFAFLSCIDNYFPGDVARVKVLEAR